MLWGASAAPIRNPNNIRAGVIWKSTDLSECWARCNTNLHPLSFTIIHHIHYPLTSSNRPCHLSLHALRIQAFGLHASRILAFYRPSTTKRQIRKMERKTDCQKTDWGKTDWMTYYLKEDGLEDGLKFVCKFRSFQTNQLLGIIIVPAPRASRVRPRPNMHYMSPVMHARKPTRAKYLLHLFSYACSNADQSWIFVAFVQLCMLKRRWKLQKVRELQ